ncbi:MAG: hypothetical protein F4103_08870 [Boseongicola sp. SB0673_bin_14]|nr:hypothetical protein [Boseongicola sp. SB0673_bin_14]
MQEMNDVEKALSVRERVTRAVHFLAIEKEDVRSRLASAFDQFVPLMEHGFPTDLQDQARRIMDASTKYEASDLDAGQKIAKDIWSLFMSVNRIVEDDLEDKAL